MNCHAVLKQNGEEKQKYDLDSKNRIRYFEMQSNTYFQVFAISIGQGIL
jgi:hypothetical protein